MSGRKIRMTIYDVTWPRCVSRVESTLSGLRGVESVKARLIRDGLGEAEVFYDPEAITLESLKQAVTSASGEKHHFRVISTQE